LSGWRGFCAPLLAAAILVSVPLHLIDVDDSSAALGDCGQPATDGEKPAASDCLFILRFAISAALCIPECICDPNGSGDGTASDALVCLKHAVGENVELLCPCDTTTTTIGQTTCKLDESGDAPVCAGGCPEELDCLIEEGLIICTCTRPCALDELFGCGGGCESPEQVCRLVQEGQCTCVSDTDSCRDLSAELGLVTGVCGGLCTNPSDECRYDGTKPEGPCLCLPRERAPDDEPVPPCGLDESQVPAVCNGFCPTPGQVCQGDADDGCTCATPASPCDFIEGAGAPLCGGNCTEPQTCVLVQASGGIGEDECRCAEPAEAGGSDPVRACGRTSTGSCSGNCSDPRVECRADPSTNTCACIPAPPIDDPLSPCSEGPDQTCAGSCPEPGQICGPTAEDGCACTTPSFACGLLDLPEGAVCAGMCAADTACVMSFDGTCSCGDPCFGNEVSGCLAGFCSRSNDACLPVPSGGDCDCLPVRRGPCTLDGTQSPPVCLGQCPNGQVCVDTGADDVACTCQPIEDTCGLRDDGVCGGPCPRIDDECRANLAKDCSCVTPIEFCQDTGAGDLVVCGGACPNPNDVCAQQPGSTSGDPCACFPPPPSTEPKSTTTTTTTTTMPGAGCVLNTSESPPVCAGDCPGSQLCRAQLDGQCACTATSNICRSVETSSGPLCTGVCPSPNDRCGRLEPEAPCTCIRFEEPCTTLEDQGALFCAGDCPPGEACFAPFRGDCACFPERVACQPVPDPGVCGGGCPSPDQACFIPAGATSCACAEPPPCGIDETKSPPACLGFCDVPNTICLANAKGDCSCQPFDAFCRPIDGVCGGTCGSPGKVCGPVTIDGTPGCQCNVLDESGLVAPP